MSRRKKGAEGSQLAWDLDFVVIARRQLMFFHPCIQLLPPSHTRAQCVQQQTRSARSGEKANFIGVPSGSNEKSREAATSWTEKSSWRMSPHALCDRSRLLFAAMCNYCCAMPSDTGLFLTYAAAPEAWVPSPAGDSLLDSLCIISVTKLEVIVNTGDIYQITKHAKQLKHISSNIWIGL